MPRQPRRSYRSPKPDRGGVPPFGDPHADLIALWSIRILLDLNGLRKYDNMLFLHQNTVFQVLGIDDAPSEDLNVIQMRDLLLSRRKVVEALNPKLSGPIVNNLRLLAESLSLSRTEVEILGFIVSVHVCEPLAEIVGTLGELDTARLISAPGVILRLPPR